MCLVLKNVPKIKEFQNQERTEKINHVTKARIMFSYISFPLFSMKPCEVQIIILILQFEKLRLRHDK